MGHKIQMYENLKDMLEREVGEIERKRDLNKESLDNLFKLTTALKVVDKCIDRYEMKEKEKEGGQSFEGYSQARGRGGNSYAEGTSNRMMPPYWMYNDGMSQEGGNSRNNASYARGNDSYAYNGQSNEGGQSTARRGRDGDSDGRYNEASRDNFRDNSNRGGSYAERGNSYEYSRDASRKKMVQKLETLMDDTMSEKERQAIQDCITKIDK